MPISKLRPSFTFTEDRLAELRAVVPEAFADGKVNWDVLREALGEHLEDEGAEAEHFGLFWPGKRQARRLAAIPSKGTLVPVPAEGVNEETTRNLFIEGDNLEVLKLLQKSYAGRVKMIYIDPPYNTGNDFVYKDDYMEPLETYLARTGQAAEDGALLTTNSKSGGRFHSAWLDMMYPRLRVARDLLRDDGIIFLSIDDNEVHNLRSILNELFGEENFIAQITILNNPKGRVLSEHFASSHEYLLVYARSATEAEFSIPKTDEEIRTQYTEQDKGGRFRLLELRNTHRQFGRFNRKNLFYPIYVHPLKLTVQLSPAPGFKEVLPIWEDGFEGCWTWGRTKAEQEAHLLVPRNIDGRWKIFRKAYAISEHGDTARRKLQTIWTDREFHTEKGQASFDELIPGLIFQSPKSVDLIKRLILVSNSDPGDIILDFFAGSCTTAQAVLEFNQRGQLPRRFIMVQLPERTPAGSRAKAAGFKTVAEIGKERIRRVIKQLLGDKRGKLKLQDEGDLGFKVYCLDESSFRAWKDYTDQDPKQLELAFEKAASPLIDGWEPNRLLVEIQILEGFPLDSSVTELAQYRKNKVQLVESDTCQHRLIVCLDKKVKDDTLERLEMQPDDVLVCLDSALTDEAKVRLGDLGNLRVI